jgi:hypothetical protein
MRFKALLDEQWVGSASALDLVQNLWSVFAAAAACGRSEEKSGFVFSTGTT